MRRDLRIVVQQRVGDDDGAGVDERVARHARLCLQLDDGVEAHARRFALDPVPERVADPVHGVGKGEELRDRLDRERLTRVARRKDLAIPRRHGDGEFRRIHGGEGWDVIGVSSLGGGWAGFGGDLVEEVLHRARLRRREVGWALAHRYVAVGQGPPYRKPTPPAL